MKVLSQGVTAVAILATAVIYGTDVFVRSCSVPPSHTSATIA